MLDLEEEARRKRQRKLAAEPRIMRHPYEQIPPKGMPQSLVFAALQKDKKAMKNA